ncbi:Pectin acetylesterase 5 [Linum grandiflorum]
MPNPRLPTWFPWSRKWGKKDWVIAAIGISVVLFTLTLLFDSGTEDPSTTVNQPFDGPISADDPVELTLLRNAKDRGAFCLDGSPPGYHFQKGFGSGSHKWVIHIEGGGWCNTIESCSYRSKTPLGSSKFMETQVVFAGILSRDPSNNPDFFNWNRVKIRYCDGASFAGHPESELKNGTKLFFRGQLIWQAVMDELLSKGMANAKQAFLTGCSAGGLATLIHCDDFRNLLPKDAPVKCLADAGFFLDEKDINGHDTMRSFYRDVVHLQGVDKSLHKDCVSKSKTDPSECLFPREIVKNVRTPIFLVHPGYDFWQIRNILVPGGSDPRGHWRKCRMGLQYCDSSQMEILQGFRKSLLNQLTDFKKNNEGGFFINSCFIHCQTWSSPTWHSPTSPRIDNKTIAQSVGDWYFNHHEVKKIDCPYPCNPTCYNMDFTPR